MNVIRGRPIPCMINSGTIFGKKCMCHLWKWILMSLTTIICHRIQHIPGSTHILDVLFCFVAVCYRSAIMTSWHFRITRPLWIHRVLPSHRVNKSEFRVFLFATGASYWTNIWLQNVSHSPCPDTSANKLYIYIYLPRCRNDSADTTKFLLLFPSVFYSCGVYINTLKMFVSFYKYLLLGSGPNDFSSLLL